MRDASSKSNNETAWLELRRNNTIAPMKTLLNRLFTSDFNAGQYIDRHSNNASTLPNIGIAVSGGGWRALLNGAGALKVFDSRTSNANTDGHLGGLLQASTYVAGLSGGSWLVGSMFINNFSSVQALQQNSDSTVWEFGRSIIKGPEMSGIGALNTADYWGTILKEVSGKDDANFDISFTDVWGRGLSYYMFEASDGGPKYTWSSIAESQGFMNGDIPMPLVVTDGRAPGATIVSLNATVYEINPFEIGSWDPTTYGFAPLKYIGTKYDNGRVTDDSKCVVGFDNAGYVIGTSSSLFNSILQDLNETDLPTVVQAAAGAILSAVGQKEDDIADWNPNPFYGFNPSGDSKVADTEQLNLVDGGEDGQNIPLNPLIQPARGVDVIFAIDSSADTDLSWPNGASLVSTYERTFANISNGTSFPSIPDENTFINLGLNSRPTFFGCNASNITDGDVPGVQVPLIVYIPNSPYVTYSNQSTFSLSTNDSYRDALIANGYDGATMGNGTLDNSWPTCVGCAILSRSFTRTGTTVPQACQQCFQDFCWDGTIDSSTPKPYQPTLKSPKKAITLNSRATSQAASTRGVTKPKPKAKKLS